MPAEFSQKPPQIFIIDSDRIRAGLLQDILKSHAVNILSDLPASELRDPVTAIREKLMRLDIEDLRPTFFVAQELPTEAKTLSKKIGLQVLDLLNQVLPNANIISSSGPVYPLGATSKEDCWPPEVRHYFSGQLDINISRSVGERVGVMVFDTSGQMKHFIPLRDLVREFLG